MLWERAMHLFLARLRFMSQRGNDQRRRIYTSYCSKAVFSLSLRISTRVQEEGFFPGSWKRNGLFFFLSSQSSCSSQDRCTIDDKQSQQFCPCKYQIHQKTQAEKFRWIVGVRTDLCPWKAGNKSTSKMGVRVWAEAPWINKVLVISLAFRTDQCLSLTTLLCLMCHLNLVP